METSDLFPYVLVNIGSGVSVIRVNGESSYDRIGGSNLGGGTFWGLCKLLTGCKSFDEALSLSVHGDHTKADLLVKDIYGDGEYPRELGPDVIASSFGRVLYCDDDQLKRNIRRSDMAKSLLYATCFNIAQIAYLTACADSARRRSRQKEGDLGPEDDPPLRRIFFCGYFIRHHPITMEMLSECISYWSKDAVQAHFFKHEGFLGSLGAFLDTAGGK